MNQIAKIPTQLANTQIIVILEMWSSSAFVALRAAAAEAEAESVKESAEGIRYTEVAVGVVSRRMRLVMVVDIWMCQVISVR